MSLDPNFMPRCEFKTRAKQGNNLRDNEKVLVVRGEEESMVWKETGLHPEKQRLPIERALFAKVQASDALKRLTHPTFGDSLVLPNLSNPPFARRRLVQSSKFY